jgi:hypothetical protein
MPNPVHSGFDEKGVINVQPATVCDEFIHFTKNLFCLFFLTALFVRDHRLLFEL